MPGVGWAEQFQCGIGGQQFHQRGRVERTFAVELQCGMLRVINRLHDYGNFREGDVGLMQGLPNFLWQAGGFCGLGESGE